MQAVTDRILSTYCMIQTSEGENKALRSAVATFLAKQYGLDEKRKAGEGLRSLRHR